ncbi:LysR family transcriptional regulator [Marivivens niveibacter]|uniref:LysR family transcriptional regulator n=1 Tax=Marivivens niveibacter TaxID=1930667 RepID=A0A251WWQ8_9RHOB|nr:LysR family transcriptional regulator [Marivivens niveibacter]OUD08403.1 LysR family transcriptional regulator [Marivivens niveibacter]
MLNATWIETFTVLAEEGHFTRAAERLNMTQPGVSQQLRKLEQQLGQRLIVQDGKSFILTPAGVAVHEMGIKRRLQETQLREMIGMDDPDIGRVQLACSGSFAMLAYPRAIHLMQAAPQLSIEIEAAPENAILIGVLDDTFDMGIVASPIEHPRLHSKIIGTEELCLIVPHDCSPTPTFAELESIGIIEHPDAQRYADMLFMQNFADEYAGADRLNKRSYINQIGQILMPVAAGIGYTILPRSGVMAYAQLDRIRIANVVKPIFRELRLITRKNKIISARMTKVMQAVSDIAETLSH